VRQKAYNGEYIFSLTHWRVLNMKFLIITKPRTVPLPENYVEIVKAAKDWLKSKLADSTLDCVYSFIPSGGIAIGNAESHEKIYDDILTYPLFPFFEWKVKPLADTDHALSSVISMLSK
jgi:hypothetical protein